MARERCAAAMSGLITLALGVAVVSVSWGAMDPRFQVSPRELDAKAGPSARKVAAGPPRTAGKAGGVRSRRSTAGRRKGGGGQAQAARKARGKETVGVASFHMLTSRDDGQTYLRTIWPRLVAPMPADPVPLVVSGGPVSVSLDPGRYPVFPAADGGAILVDGSGSLTPSIRALLQEKHPRLRIVTGSPRQGKRFYPQMFRAAGFFSVEENFSLAYGTDPRLTVTTDYKIEPTADSLLQHDIVLLNLPERPDVPPEVHSFLQQEGFRLLARTGSGDEYQGPRSTIRMVAAPNHRTVTDALLSALEIRADQDRRLTLAGGDESGLAISVTADRYFETARGERHLLFLPGGDPPSQSTRSVLEERGYRVTILETGDDFPAIARKLLPTLGSSGFYGRYDMLPQWQGSVGITLSGVLLPREGGRETVFVTDRSLDPVFRSLLIAGGYRIAPD